MITDFSTSSNTYHYEIFDEKGRLYRPKGNQWEKILVREEVIESKEYVELSTFFDFQSINPLSKNKQYIYHLNLLPNGKIEKLICLFFNTNQHSENKNILLTKYFFTDNEYLSIYKKNKFNEKWVSRERKGNYVPFHVMGILHYYVFYSMEMKKLINNLRNNQMSSIIGKKIKSIEMNPTYGSIFYWTLVIKSISEELISVTGKEYQSYKITFRIIPTLIFKIISIFMNLNLELDFWLDKKQDRLIQFEEYAGNGSKITYKLVHQD